MLKRYEIEKFEIHHADPKHTYVAFYSNDEYLGVSEYILGEFHGVWTHQPRYEITGGCAPDSIKEVPIEEMNQLLNEC